MGDCIVKPCLFFTILTCCVDKILRMEQPTHSDKAYLIKLRQILRLFFIFHI